MIEPHRIALESNIDYTTLSLAEVRTALGDIARDVEATFSRLTAPQLNWRPDATRWSVGQCLEHLYIANEVYLPPMTQALQGQSPSAVEQVTPGWFGRYFIRTYIDPTTQKARAKAPGKIRPAQRVDADILARFLRSNDAARDLVRRASAFDVNRIRFKNPFVGGIRFTVGTGIEIIWRHQRRHLLQAERARAGIDLSSVR